MHGVVVYEVYNNNNIDYCCRVYTPQQQHIMLLVDMTGTAQRESVYTKILYYIKIAI